jgi:four helix bundle protein
MNEYQKKLKYKMDEYVHFIYNITEGFPKEERFGVTAQIRRSAMSTILNYIEGYARRRIAVRFNFLETSYGSLRESRYLIYFSYKRKYIGADDMKSGINLADEIGAMLWTEIKNVEKKIK